MDLKQTIRIFYDGTGASQAVLGLGKVTTTAQTAQMATARLAKAMQMAFGAVIIGSILAVAKAFKQGAKDFRVFNLEMTKSLSIMTNVTKAQENQMKTLAKATSITMNMEIGEVARSYFYLASAGLDAVQSIGALPEVAKFAKAGAFDMARATDLSTDALSAMGLKSADAAENLENLVRVQDVLVKANTLSNATVEQFSESLTNRAANAMRAVNMEIESGVAVLAVWADQGVKGAYAGTRFEIVLRDLQTASQKNSAVWKEQLVDVYDSAGGFRNLADIITDLEKSLEGMSTKQVTAMLRTMGFTDRSISATKSLLGYSDAIRDYEEKLKKAGGTTDLVARKQMAAFDEQIGKIGKRMRVSLMTGVEPFMEGLNSLFTTINKNARTSQELIDDMRATNAELNNLGEAKSALKTLNDLGKSQQLSSTESKKLGLAMESLAKLFPDMIKDYDDAGKALSFYNTQLQDSINLKVQMAKASLREDLSGLSSSKKGSEGNLSLAKLRQQTAFNLAKEKSDLNAYYQAIGKGDTWRAKRNAEQLAHQHKMIALGNVEISQYESELDLIDGQMRAIVEIVGKGSVIDSLFGSGEMTLKEASEYIDKIMGSVNAQPKPGGGENPKEDPYSLAAEIAKAQELVDRLVDTKEATNELAEANLALIKLQEIQNELQHTGLEQYERDMQTKKDAIAEEKARLKELLALEEKVAEAVKKGANLKKMDLKPIDPMLDTPENAVTWSLLKIARLQREFDKKENEIKFNVKIDEEAQEAQIETLKRNTRLAMEEIANEIETALRLVDPASADRFRAQWVSAQSAFKAGLKDGKKDTKAIKENFTNIARSARAILQLGDVFGGLSEGTRRFADGMISIIDNLGSLKTLGSDAGFLEKLVPILGIGGGVVTILASAFGGGQSIEEAIIENTRRIEKAVKDLAEDPRPTSGVSSDDLDRLESIFMSAILTTAGIDTSDDSVDRGFPRQVIRTAINEFEELFALLEELELSGIDADVIETLKTNLLRSLRGTDVFDTEGNLIANDIDQNQLDDAINQLYSVLNSFLFGAGDFNTSNLAGILAASSALQDLGMGTNKEVFDMMLEQLMLMVSADSDVFALLDNLKVLDPERDAEQIKRLIADVTRQIVSGGGTFDFGNLNPEEFDEILRFLSGITGDVSQAEDVTKSVQIGRSINEIQANEWIAIGESQLLRLTQIKNLLEGQQQGSGGSLLGLGRPSSGSIGISVNAPIGITIAGTDEQAIQQIMYELEQKVRLAIREGRTA